MFEPTFCESDSPRQATMGIGFGEPLDSIAHLASLERLVLILSVFERYTVQECSLLLSSTRADVIGARTRALQKLAGIVSREAAA
jgi:DNA-directed RNA polymerase specialized sigma24 family protein